MSPSDCLVSINLWNGIATLKIKPPSFANVGKEIKISVKVKGANLSKPLASSFVLKVVDPIDKHRSDHSGKNSKKRDVGREKVPIGLEPPNIVPIKMDKWKEYDFNEYSDLFMKKQGNNFDAFVNMDNVFLQREIKISKDEPELIMSQYKYGLVLISLGIYYTLKQKKVNGKDNNGKTSLEESDILSRINEVSSGHAMMLFPCLKSLNKIVK